MFKSTMAVATVNLAGVALNLAMAVILARLLGVEGFGVYTALFILATLVSVLFGAGLPNVLLREAVVSLHDMSTERLYGLVLFGLTALGTTSLIGALVLRPIMQRLYPEIDVTVEVTLLVLLLALFLAIAEAISGFLQGLHKVNLGRLIAVLRPAFIVLLLIGAYLIGNVTHEAHMLDARGAMWLHTTAAIAAVPVLGYFLLLHLPQGTFGSVPEIHWARWSRSAASVLMGRLALTLQQTLPMLLLSAMSSAAETGLFRVAERSAFFASFGLTAVGMVVQPRVAQAFRAGNRVGMHHVLNRGAWAILLFTLPVVLVLVLAPTYLLHVLFGPEYGAAAPLLIVLALAQAINGATGLTTSTLVMVRKEWVAALAQCLAVTIALGLGIWLIPSMGGYGAAIASSAGLVTANLLMLAYLTWAMRIPTTIFAFPRPKPSERSP